MALAIANVALVCAAARLSVGPITAVEPTAGLGGGSTGSPGRTADFVAPETDDIAYRHRTEGDVWPAGSDPTRVDAADGSPMSERWTVSPGSLPVRAESDETGSVSIDPAGVGRAMRVPETAWERVIGPWLEAARRWSRRCAESVTAEISLPDALHPDLIELRLASEADGGVGLREHLSVRSDA